MKLRGRVVDEDQDLRDVAVWVGSNKVYLVSGGSGANPRDLPFDVELDLEPGANFVTSMAREGERYATQKAVVISTPGGIDKKDKKDSADDAPPLVP